MKYMKPYSQMIFDIQMLDLMKTDVEMLVKGKFCILHSVSNRPRYRRLFRFIQRNLWQVPGKIGDATLQALLSGPLVVPTVVGGLLAGPLVKKGIKYIKWSGNQKDFKAINNLSPGIEIIYGDWNKKFNPHSVSLEITHSVLNDIANLTEELELNWNALTNKQFANQNFQTCDDVWSFYEHQFRLAESISDIIKIEDPFFKLMAFGNKVLDSLTATDDKLGSNFQSRKNKTIELAKTRWEEKTLEEMQKLANGSKVFHNKVWSHDYEDWIRSHNPNVDITPAEGGDISLVLSGDNNPIRTLRAQNAKLASDAVKMGVAVSATTKVGSLAYASIKNGTPLSWTSGATVASQLAFKAIYESLNLSGVSYASIQEGWEKQRRSKEMFHFQNENMVHLEKIRASMKKLIPVFSSKLSNLTAAVDTFMNRTKWMPNTEVAQERIEPYVEDLLQIQKYMDQVKALLSALEMWTAFTIGRAHYIDNLSAEIHKQCERKVDDFFLGHHLPCGGNKMVCYCNAKYPIEKMKIIQPKKAEALQKWSSQPVLGILPNGNYYGLNAR